MFSKFFIERPVFATVLSVIIVIVGGVALLQLPIAQYPEVTPPTINVTTSYPGASAQTVADTVATPIEQQINGVEKMLYMESRCTNDGQMSLDVTFELGTDLDMAQVLVQNRVSIANAKLPSEVRQQGVTTKKKSPSILLAINLISDKTKDPVTGQDRYKHSQLDLSNYATINISDELARLKGVGAVNFLGARDYSMRIWLDPEKLASRSLMPSDVTRAVSKQNVQVAAGRIGQPPTPGYIYFQTPIITQGRLATAEEFGAIILKSGSQGQQTFLRDVVRDRVAEVLLDPERLKKHSLTAKDVAGALKKRQLRIRAENFGGMQLFLDTQEGYRISETLVNEARDGPAVQLGEVTRLEGGIVDVQRGIELGALNYDVNSYLDGQPTITLAVFQLPGSNAIATAQAVKDKMEELSRNFPPGMRREIVYDTTVFVNESISAVYHTLFEAFILVFIVVLVFLQDWRATIMPMIEVPVSLIGTFGIMALLGFSLNNLSLFGLVLAIGIVVDDAIVVVESVETWLAKGYSPKEATIKAMEETAGPILGIGCVLVAVFVPTAFLSGISGQFFKQFALTIAASTVISAINALSMTPARAALIMKPHHAGHRKEAFPPIFVPLGLGLLLAWLVTPLLAGMFGDSPKTEWGIRAVLFAAGCIPGWIIRHRFNDVLAVPLRGFDWVFARATNGYGKGVHMALKLSAIMLLVYGGLMALTVLGFRTTPTGFIPSQDKGYLLANAQLPEGANLSRSDKVVRKMAEIAREDEGVADTLELAGYSLLNSSNLPNTGGMFVILKPFEERAKDPRLSGPAVAKRLRERFAQEVSKATGEDPRMAIFGAPPIDGLGSTGGLKMQVQDRRGQGGLPLQGAVQNLAARGNAQEGRLVGLFSSYSANQPQMFLKIDREKAEAENIDVQDVFDTVKIYLGSAYVNDVTIFNRNWQVLVQADEHARLQPHDIGQLKVRTRDGKMVPLGTMISYKDVAGPSIVNRFNMFPSAEVNGSPAPGFSSGQAIALMEELAKDLPDGMTPAWTELTYQQILAEKDLLAKLVFPLSILFVYLTLAALYEDWILPLSIILIVPMCMLSALGGVRMNGLDNDIFTQIGLVVLVGLASKNAILMVAFAKQRQQEGLNAFDAAVDASAARLRPILMTAFAFILGVVPLMLSSGAGSEMRRALGVAVFWGMLGVTVFGVFFTPVFYYVLRRLTGQGEAVPAAAPGPAESPKHLHG